jgi:peptidoglycan/LPS O-acetylase OafA/YrhL
VSDSLPSAAGPAPDDGAPRPMPTSARVAVVTMGVLAAVLILYAAITWLGREGLAEAVARAQPELSADEAARYVLVSALPYFLAGLALALAAWFLPQRRRWARWTGLGASFLLAVLILLGMASIGGVTPISLLVLVLAVAAFTSLLARTTRDWFPRVRIGA